MRPPPSWPAAITSAGNIKSETGNRQLKTYLRGPGKILRSESPDMVKQEIWGYLLTHYAISALICTAATAAGIDPDRVKFKRTVRIIRRRAAEPAFSPPPPPARPGPGSAPPTRPPAPKKTGARPAPPASQRPPATTTIPSRN